MGSWTIGYIATSTRAYTMCVWRDMLTEVLLQQHTLAEVDAARLMYICGHAPRRASECGLSVEFMGFRLLQIVGAPISEPAR